jgi:SH3-like domain-containing protein
MKWAGFALVAAFGVYAAAQMVGSRSQSEARAATPPAIAVTTELGQSGLPVPRFVSLKNQRVNVRRGPSQAHPVAWQFQRAGLPVEITREFENWRMIRDAEGEEGWVFHSLLSGARTAVVAPWDRDMQLRPLRDEPRQGADEVARVEPRVVVRIERCDGLWCEVEAGGYSGWMPQADLWGVYAGERL